jgi:hypothetical protein
MLILRKKKKCNLVDLEVQVTCNPPLTLPSKIICEWAPAWKVDKGCQAPDWILVVKPWR